MFNNVNSSAACNDSISETVVYSCDGILYSMLQKGTYVNTDASPKEE
jgi:hypothetical protein